MHVFHVPNAYDFERVGIKGKVFPVKLVTNKNGVVLIETEQGHQTTIINHVCDVLYYILEGSGYFEINGIKENYEQGDLVVIPANSPFTYKGKARMLRITTPPFYPEQEETME